MATLNGNNAYFAFQGLDMSGYFTDTTGLDGSVSNTDTTAGAGQTHIQRQPGLIDNTFSVVLVYDDEQINTYVTTIKKGARGLVEYGPDGNDTGKPRFACDMILTSVTGPNVSIAKEKVMFELSFEQADKPIAEIDNGDTF